MIPTTSAVIFPILWPVGSSVPVYRTPVVTYALMGVNLLFFLLGLVNMDWAVQTLALHQMSQGGHWFQFLTYAFLHVGGVFGFIHLASNMLFFWIFACGLENKIGPWRMLGLYVLTGILAGVAHNAFVMPSDTRPLVGASGAVFGIIGAYMMLFPFSTIRCFFCLLVVVVPMVVRICNIMAFFFFFIYMGIELIIPLMLLHFFVVVDMSSVSHIAHVAGLAAGAGLAAAFYGFYAFSPQASEDQAQEIRLKHKLAKELKRPSAPDLTPEILNQRLSEPKASTASSSAADPQVKQIYELWVKGDKMDACQRYLAMTDQNLDACLAPVDQLELARYMIEIQEIKASVEAYGRLIRLHPQAEVVDIARLELARLLIQQGLHPELAREHLQALLKSQITFDMEMETLGLLGKLPEHPPSSAPRGSGSGGTSALFDGDWEKQSPENKPEPKLDPKQLLARTHQLFGDPEETGDNYLNKVEPATSAPVGASSREEESVEQAIHLADFESTPHDPAWDQNAQPMEGVYPSFQAHGVGEMEFSAPRGGLTPQRDPIEEMLNFELAPPPSLEDFTDGVSSTHGTHLKTPLEMGDAFDRARNQGEPFCVILAPGCPVMMPVIVAVLGPVWGLSPDGTHHAVLRRRGIIAEVLTYQEAEAIARQLALHGQQVMVAVQKSAQGFGRPIDVLNMREESKGLCFSSQSQLIHAAWDQVACVGCGRVKITYNAPERVLCDLWLKSGQHRLLLWGSSFNCPKELGPTPELRFKTLVQWIAKRTSGSIQTHSLTHWLEGNGELPQEKFASQIEYDNFLRWHLMAYYAPNRLFQGKSVTV